jgi:hypothetical protein
MTSIPLKNPLQLNAWQLKTLAILQKLAGLPEFATKNADETISIRAWPAAHHDHLHVGPFIVRATDATGLGQPAVMTALARKGLLQFEEGSRAAISLTPLGLAYSTGIEQAILIAAEQQKS